MILMKRKCQECLWPFPAFFFLWEYHVSRRSLFDDFNSYRNPCRDYVDKQSMAGSL